MSELLELDAAVREKPADFQRFRFLHESDEAYFQDFFSRKPNDDACVVAIKERGYRDADVAIILTRFGDYTYVGVVADRLEQFPEYDACALFDAMRASQYPFLATVNSYVAEHIDFHARQPGFAEHMAESSQGREFLVLNLSHMRDLSSVVAQKLISADFRLAVLGHLIAFAPEALNVKELVDEMVQRGELSEEVRRECMHVMTDPEELYNIILRVRKDHIQLMFTTSDDNARRKLLIQIVPDAALCHAERAGMRGGSLYAGELLFEIHEFGMEFALAGDMPQILKDHFEASEEDFFRDVSVRRIALWMDRVRRLSDSGASAEYDRSQVWCVERYLLENIHHVAGGLKAQEHYFKQGRGADPVEQQKIRDIIEVVIQAGKSFQTCDEYAPLAREIAEKPSIFLLQQTDLIAFFDAYAETGESGLGNLLFARIIDECMQSTDYVSADVFLQAVRAVVVRWDGEDRVRAIERLFEFLPRFKEVEWDAHAFLLSCTEQSITVRALTFFTQKNIPIDASILRTWRRCSPPERLPEKCRTEVGVMEKFERERPGGCRLLRNEFGIENYSRYSLEQLLDQYDTRDDQSLPYGVVINSKTDYNGAFERSDTAANGDVDCIAKLYDDIAQRYRLRVYEAGSKVDFVRMLARIKRRYIQPSGNKISFALIGGHGHPEGISMGRQRDIGEITVDDLKGKGVATLGGAYFEPGATVILRSCSTGQRSAIGQKLSKLLGIRVIAPDQPANIKGITVIFNKEGRLSFSVDFLTGKSEYYAAGLPVNR